MNVLTETVNFLADEKGSLTNGLYKLKLLASRIKNVELSNWINKELNGYEKEDVLPDYRITSSQLIGYFTNGYQDLPNQQIPFYVLPENFYNVIAPNYAIYQSIPIVQDFANHKDDSIELMLDATLAAILTQCMYKKDMIRGHGVRLYKLNVRVSTKSYTNILMSVRSYAMDLALALESELGYEVEIKEIIKRKEETNQIIHNYMTQNNITNIGDGNLVNTGDNNTITQNTVIQKGNFDQLRQTLSQIGLEAEDINELEDIVKNDNTDVENQEFGDRVKDWLKKMTIKYWEKGKQLGLGAISSVAGSLISNFLFGI